MKYKVFILTLSIFGWGEGESEDNHEANEWLDFAAYKVSTGSAGNFIFENFIRRLTNNSAGNYL